MSRAFNGTEQIVVTPSGSVPSNQGNFTIMALIKQVTNITNDHWIVQGYNSSNAGAWDLLETSSKYYNGSNFGGGFGTPVLNKWVWVGYSKASGSVKPQWHFKNLTDSGAWSHTTDASNVADQTGPPVKITIGGKQSNTTGIIGSIAAIATWGSVVSDVNVESYCASALALQGSSLAWGVLLNQASTGTAVTDLSGHGATQSSISGTSVDADDPPGWSYSLTPPGPTVKLWNGTAEVAVTVKLWDGSAEQTVTLSSIV